MAKRRHYVRDSRGRFAKVGGKRRTKHVPRGGHYLTHAQRAGRQRHADEVRYG